MALLSELYVTTAADAQRYDQDPESFAPHRAEFRDLTYEEFANLWAVLRNEQPNEGDLDAFEAILAMDGGQRLINRFPDDFVARLAGLESDDLTLIAEKWIQFGELSYMECQPADVVPILEALHLLAKVRQQDQKLLCLWMCV